MKFIRHGSLICLFAVLIAGCYKPYKRPLIEPADAAFEGVMQYQNSRIIMIHGMCHHDKQWAIENTAELKKHLGLSGEEPKKVWPPSPNGVELYQTVLTGKGRTVQVFGIIFSGLTLPIKRDALCSNVSEKSVQCPDEDVLYDKTQAKLNAQLKNSLLNDCLADALIYIGKNGERIRDGVRAAILEALKRSIASDVSANAPLVFIPESLGSKILFDVLLCAVDEDQDFLETQFAQATQLYFQANQIPMLDLGFKEEDCHRKRAQTDYKRLSEHAGGLGQLKEFVTIINNKKREQLKFTPDKTLAVAIATPLKIISFNDPNDLLSYEIPAGSLGETEVINVTVSNSSTFAGLIEEPYSAHTHYRKNKSVVELIGCGKEAGATVPRSKTECMSIGTMSDETGQYEEGR